MNLKFYCLSKENTIHFNSMKRIDYYSLYREGIEFQSSTRRKGGREEDNRRRNMFNDVMVTVEL